MPSAIRETKEEALTRLTCDLHAWAETICHVSEDPRPFVIALSRLLAAMSVTYSNRLAKSQSKSKSDFIALVIECIQLHADTAQQEAERQKGH